MQITESVDNQTCPVNSAKCRIDNPFKHLPNLAELHRCGTDFAQLIDSESPEEQLFKIAARIAYDPPNWDNPDNRQQIKITDHEAAALRKAKEADFWHQPRPLQVTVISLCFSAIVQGFCQSILNGSNITLPIAFELTDQNNNWKGEQSLWIFASLNAIVYLSAGLCGCWFADPLQSSYLGRRYAILLSALLCFAAVIGSSFTQNWKQLMGCRALLGCALGAKASITPIFCAEVSPSHLRGALVINWQLYDAFGIFLGFSSGLLLSSTGLLSWRLQTASACIPTAALILLIWTVPESPRWLLKKGRYGEAFAAMCALRHSRLEAAVELLYANEQVQAEVMYLPKLSSVNTIEAGTNNNTVRLQQAAHDSSYLSRIRLLFLNARTRRATVAAAVVMLGQQLCGINVLAFYGTTFIRDIKGANSAANPTSALWMSWGIGLTNFVSAFPAYYWIDKRGRRFLLLVTYPGMILSMFAACISFLREDESVRFVLVCTFLFIFVVFYSVGQGPVAFAYASEVFPLLNREAGMSFSVFVNLTGAGILTLLVPQAQVTKDGPDNNGQTWQVVQIRLLAVFTVLNVISLIMIFCLVPETAGATVGKEQNTMNYMSLEELNYIFKFRTKYHTRAGWERIRRTFRWRHNNDNKSDMMYDFHIPEANVFSEQSGAGIGDHLLPEVVDDRIVPDRATNYAQPDPDVDDQALGPEETQTYTSWLQREARVQEDLADEDSEDRIQRVNQPPTTTAVAAAANPSGHIDSNPTRTHIQRQVIIDYLTNTLTELKRMND